MGADRDRHPGHRVLDHRIRSDAEDESGEKSGRRQRRHRIQLVLGFDCGWIGCGGQFDLLGWLLVSWILVGLGIVLEAAAWFRALVVVRGWGVVFLVGSGAS